MKTNVISDDILEIAKNILSPKKLQEAEYLCEQYRDRKKQSLVKKTLWDLLSNKTPHSDINAKAIDYARYDLGHLSSRTRNIVERASASIELLCYWLLVENGGEYPSNDPLGTILNKLEKRNVLDPEFLSVLRRFNRYALVPAKHDYEINPDKQHLFSVDEAVFIVYIVTAISRKLWPYFKKHTLFCGEEIWE